MGSQTGTKSTYVAIAIATSCIVLLNSWTYSNSSDLAQKEFSQLRALVADQNMRFSGIEQKLQELRTAITSQQAPMASQNERFSGIAHELEELRTATASQQAPMASQNELLKSMVSELHKLEQTQTAMASHPAPTELHKLEETQTAMASHPAPMVVAQPTPGTAVATRGSREGHEKKCRLPELAEIVDIKMTKEACIWHAVDPTGKGECSFKLTGVCNLVFHEESGCTFYGYPRNEQYQPGNFALPDPVPGEIEMTPDEEATLRKPFENCDSRVRFFRAEEPLLRHGKAVGGIGTPKKPLVLMAGGSPGINQHFYFVLGEVGMADSYRLGWHEPKNMKVIVDIGANIGLFSISVCLRFPHARILAFEPHPANFRFLMNNLKEAGCEHRVEAFNRGVSKDGRSLKLYWHDSIGTTAYEHSETDGTTNHITMQTISPETLMEHVGTDDVSLLKIDCEGCEFEVVPLLPKSRINSMFCEYHQGALNNMGGGAALGKEVEEACKAGNKWGVFVPA